jgi:hypothetical protein
VVRDITPNLCWQLSQNSRSPRSRSLQKRSWTRIPIQNDQVGAPCHTHSHPVPACGQVSHYGGAWQQETLSEFLTKMEKFLYSKDMLSFYAYHYLVRMPREVRVLLTKEDTLRRLTSSCLSTSCSTTMPWQLCSLRWPKKKLQRRQPRWQPLAAKVARKTATINKTNSGSHPTVVRRRCRYAGLISEDLQLPQTMCLAENPSSRGECNIIHTGRPFSAAASTGPPEAPLAAL